MADQSYTQRSRQSLEQTAALLFGIVFLIVGIGGFIPGLTTQFERVTSIGGEGGHLLGIFGVNWLENVVHLGYAAAGLYAATSAILSRSYFLWGGIIYGVVWLYGILIDLDSSANLIGVNEAGNWLHLTLFLTMVGLGLFFKSRQGARAGA